ncbi:hypothetical protein IT396_03665 [Candidatus Nomurabacteria bacterium]|nr:hypothetical protein [Candidatus Nomurabacteria bacterium]
MWLKGMPFIVFALFIDILQAGISLSIIGLLAGVNAIPILGQITSAASMPLGIAMGVAINGSISLTAGVGHMFGMYITFNSNSHRLKTRIEAIILRRIFIALFGEIIPGVNNLPWWTIATILTIRSIHKEERKAADEAEERAETQPAENSRVNIDGVRVNNQSYATAA